MTTLQKLMDYYDQWSRINKAHDELLSNGWIINETTMDMWIKDNNVLMSYNEILRKDMINKLTYIINADKEYEVLTRLQISSIEYCLEVLKNRTDLTILCLFHGEYKIYIGTFKPTIGFIYL